MKTFDKLQSYIFPSLWEPSKTCK